MEWGRFTLRHPHAWWMIVGGGSSLYQILRNPGLGASCPCLLGVSTLWSRWAAGTPKPLGLDLPGTLLQLWAVIILGKVLTKYLK